jgi:uncharacterized protein YggT (Ycf19 family)
MPEDTQVKEEITTVSRTAPAEVIKTTTVVSPPPVQTEHPQKVYKKKKVIFRTYQVVIYILVFIEVLLAFRVFLKLFAANPNSGFTALIYAITDPLAIPFRGIFQTSSTQTGSLVEWSTFVAMMVYVLVAYGVIQLMQFIKPTTPEEVEQKVDN